MALLKTFFEWFDLSRLAIVPAALIAIVFHETCHGFAAYLLGDPTAKDRGRISLNPLRHVDIVGLLMLVVAGFGWAKPVPVDPRYFKNPRAGMALTALAGPVSNFFLAWLSLLIYACILPFYNPYAGSLVPNILNFLIILASINIGLGVFNLFIVPPLDGSKVLFSFLPDGLYGKLLFYERYGMIFLVILLYAGVLDKPLIAARTAVFNFLLSISAFPYDIIMNFM